MEKYGIHVCFLIDLLLKKFISRLAPQDKDVFCNYSPRFNSYILYAHRGSSYKRP